MIGVGIDFMSRRAGFGGGGGGSSGSAVALDFVRRGPVVEALFAQDSYAAWVNDPAYADRMADFQAAGAPSTFASIVTFARSSVANDLDVFGGLSQAASGAVRVGYDAAGAPAGMLIESSAQNTVTINDGTGAAAFTGTVAKLQATVSAGAVTGVTVIDGGSGYSVAPTIVFVRVTADNTASGATATATVSGGAITSVAVNAGGTGYNSVPLVTARTGTVPTGYTAGPFSLVGSGIESGIPYIDIRLRASSPGASLYTDFLIPCGLTFTAPQTVTSSAYLRIVAGSLAGIASPSLISYAAGDFNQNSQAAVAGVTGAALASQRVSVVKTFTGAATGISSRIAMTLGSGDVDLTLRVGLPMVELNYYASTPIVTSGTVQTRQADSASISGAAFVNAFGNGRSVTNATLQSETLDNATWSKIATSIAANTGATTDPAGGATADKIIEDTTTGNHRTDQSVTIASGWTTMSGYFKAAERSTVMLQWDGGNVGGVSSGCNAFYNLTTGTITTAASSSGNLSQPVANIVAVSGGWYRCSLTFFNAFAAASGAFRVFLHNGSATSYAGDVSGTFGVYAWGMMLEASPAAPAPNLLLAQEALYYASWGKAAATIAANNQISPDGTQSADKLQEDATTAGHYVSQTTAATIGLPYVLSFYAKAIERAAVQAILTSIGTASGNVVANFDLSGAGQASAVNAGVATIAAVPGATGWYRCTLIVPAASQTVSSTVQIRTLAAYAVATSSAASYAGTAGSGLAVWGVNLQQAPAAPPYVPLSSLVSPYVATTTAAVTKTGITEAVVIVEAMLPQVAAASSQHIAALSDGTLTNRVQIFNGGLSNNLAAFASATGQNFQTSPFAFTAGATFRAAIRIAPGSVGGFAISFVVNGGAVTSGPVPMGAGLNQLQIGGTSLGPSMNGRVRKLWLATTATDAQLIAATVANADVDAALRS